MNKHSYQERKYWHRRKRNSHRRWQRRKLIATVRDLNPAHKQKPRLSNSEWLSEQHMKEACR